MYISMNYIIQEFVLSPEDVETFLLRVKCRNKGPGKDQSINQERFNSLVESLSNDTWISMCVCVCESE